MAKSRAKDFVNDRTKEMGGLFLIALSIFFAVSFLTYNPFDPSFNLYSDDEIKNIAGRPGAFIADPLLQFFGVACFIIVFVVFSWGVIKVKKRKIKFVWIKLIFLILALFLFSMLFSPLTNTPETWPFQSYGGYVGSLLFERANNYAKLPTLIITLTLFSAAALYLAVGITIYDWCEVLLKINEYIRFVLTYCYLSVARFYKYATNAEVEEDETLFNKVKKKEITRKEPEISKKSPGRISDARQASLDLKIPNEFELPSLDFLSEPPAKSKKNVLNETALAQNAKLLEQVLDDFGVNGKITRISPGPVVTLYELEPSAGTKSSRVIGLADDIARSMSAVSARIAVIPGKNAIGIELPNLSRETVYLRELLEGMKFENSDHKLPLALGKGIGGEEIVVDLAKMPHLLVAGTTGSGKSVSVNTMILSLLYKLRPDECKFIMIDPKMLELSVYDGIPHLLAPVVTEPKKAIVALKWVVKEMESRYRLMSNLSVRNITGYNKKIEEAKREGITLNRSVQTGFDIDTGKPIIETVPFNMEQMPYIVVIVDEMADLMIVAGKEIEGSIQRLAQMARAAGIHIIMATQRPSVDVITGVIKANLPTRISFQVTSRIDSRTILGEQGAEQLLGMGDMLYMSGGSRITRIHGPFVDDAEVHKVVEFLKEQGTPNYMEEVTADDEEFSASGLEVGGDGEEGDLYRQAVTIVLRDRKASTSYVQRALRIGYNRAANIIERMEKEGIVSPANHVGKREILREGNED